MKYILGSYKRCYKCVACAYISKYRYANEGVCPECGHSDGSVALDTEAIIARPIYKKRMFIKLTFSHYEEKKNEFV